MTKWTKHKMWMETEHIAISICTEDDALSAFGKGKNIFIINHEVEELLLQIQNSSHHFISVNTRII